MADIQKRVAVGGVRWDVRYSDESRRQGKKSFDRKVDAQRFAVSVETDLIRGDWIDPDRGRELFDEWADRWLATIADRKPKTRETYESIVRRHLIPRFGKAPIAAIDYPTVLTFVAELRQADVAAKTVRNIRDVMRSIFKLAVRSGALKSNPVVDVPVARTSRAEMVFLEPDRIMDLASEVAKPPVRYRRGERRVDGYPEYGLLVRFAAFTGLRAGELVGLRVKDLHLMQRRVHVHQSASEAYGQLQIVATKTYERRSVPIPSRSSTSLPSSLPGSVRTTSCGRAPRVARSATRTGSSDTSSQLSNGRTYRTRPGSTTCGTAMRRCSLPRALIPERSWSGWVTAPSR